MTRTDATPIDAADAMPKHDEDRDGTPDDLDPCKVLSSPMIERDLDPDDQIPNTTPLFATFQTLAGFTQMGGTVMLNGDDVNLQEDARIVTQAPVTNADQIIVVGDYTGADTTGSAYDLVLHEGGSYAVCRFNGVMTCGGAPGDGCLEVSDGIAPPLDSNPFRRPFNSLRRMTMKRDSMGVSCIAEGDASYSVTVFANVVMPTTGSIELHVTQAGAVRVESLIVYGH